MDKKKLVDENYIGVDDAAEYLGIKTVTLRNWIKKKPELFWNWSKLSFLVFPSISTLVKIGLLTVWIGGCKLKPRLQVSNLLFKMFCYLFWMCSFQSIRCC